MSWFLLLYDYAPDYMERRGRFRDEHLRLAKEALARGELRLGGAYGDTADGGVLVWRAPDQATVERFVASDPYVKNGLVTRWRIRPWTVVIGGDAG